MLRTKNAKNPQLANEVLELLQCRDGESNEVTTLGNFLNAAEEMNQRFKGYDKKRLRQILDFDEVEEDEKRLRQELTLKRKRETNKLAICLYALTYNQELLQYMKTTVITIFIFNSTAILNSSFFIITQL